jgi:drug/metabolite transporter (DMT)-like permease
LAGLDIFVFNGIRYIIAFALLMFILRSRSLSIKIASTDRIKIIWLGILIIINQCAFIIGLKNTTAGNAAVILSTSTLWTTFFSARVNKERIISQTWIGMTISLLGIILIVVGSGKKLEVGSNAIYGDLLMLSAAIIWGLNAVLQKPLLARYTTVELSVITIGIGMIGLTLLAIVPAATLDWTTVSSPAVIAAILSGALSIGTANIIWLYGIKRLGPSSAANFNNLIPIFAFIIAYFTLGEDVMQLQMLGAGIIILGVWIARC